MHFKNFILLGFLSLIFSVGAFAQDFHYTQYFHSPLGVNPALAGAFNGSYRINGVVRDQNRPVGGNSYFGYSLNVDAPIIRGIRKQDWVGIGLRLESSTAGSANQKINIYGLGASYHLSLDKKQTQILSLGVQYGTGGYSYSGIDLAGDDNAFGSTIIGGAAGISLQAEEFQSSGTPTSGGGNNNTDIGGSLNDLTVGLLYNTRDVKNGTDFKLGLGIEGILNPNRSAGIRVEGAGGVRDNKGIGINAFTAYEFELTKRASLTSGAYYYTNKKASALNVNSIMNYKMKPDNALTLHAGLGLRNIRAGLIYLGTSIKDIRVGLAYDLDISSATTASGGHGGVELAVSYIGKIYKKPKPKPIIYCPRL